MDDFHISRELLRAIERGELPRETLTRLAARHLVSLCPDCRAEYEAWSLERDRFDYSGLEERTMARLEARLPAVRREEAEARKDLRTLLRCPREDRAGKIERARTRYRSLLLARLLLEESRGSKGVDPDRSLHFADLAGRVTRRSDSGDEAGVYALSQALMGNAHRAANDYRAAGECFERARREAREKGISDPLVSAEIDDLEGSYWKDRREFETAEELLGRAALQYRMIGHDEGHTRVLLTLAITYYDEGSFEDAIETTRMSLARIDPEKDPKLHLCAQHNLSLFLARAGHFAEAKRNLERNLPLYRAQLADWQNLDLRLDWLRASIDQGLGTTADVERRLLRVRDAFAEQDLAYDAGLVCLDLALLYLGQGRSSELSEIAVAMAGIFETQEIHREVFSALILLEESLRQRTITVATIEKIKSYLERARTDPQLQIEEPS